MSSIFDFLSLEIIRGMGNYLPQAFVPSISALLIRHLKAA